MIFDVPCRSLDFLICQNARKIISDIPIYVYASVLYLCIRKRRR